MRMVKGPFCVDCREEIRAITVPNEHGYPKMKWEHLAMGVVCDVLRIRPEWEVVRERTPSQV